MTFHDIVSSCKRHNINPLGPPQVCTICLPSTPPCGHTMTTLKMNELWFDSEHLERQSASSVVACTQETNATSSIGTLVGTSADSLQTEPGAICTRTRPLPCQHTTVTAPHCSQRRSSWLILHRPSLGPGCSRTCSELGKRPDRALRDRHRVTGECERSRHGSADSPMCRSPLAYGGPSRKTKRGPFAFSH